MNGPLVVITGAGASVMLGKNGKQLPAMQGWARFLCNDLHQYATALGLRTDMQGDEFEQRIGDFLRFAQGLKAVAPYPKLGLANPSLDSDQAATAWFNQASAACETIERTLYDSLHDLFGGSKVDSHAATTAWRKLLDRLEIRRLSVATTNYDPSAEMALKNLDRRPYCGTDATVEPGQLERVYLGDASLRDDSTRTPLLYLHGRAGWYVTPTGDVMASPLGSRYNPDAGSPAMLLPDPSKDYRNAPVNELWNAFSGLLTQADKVLVLGHSLHDERLLQALRSVSDNHLAVTVCVPGMQGRADWDEAAAEMMQRIGRSPHIIPMSFGPELCVDRHRLEAFTSGGPPSHSSNAAELTII